jgi:hypothetical protein
MRRGRKAPRPRWRSRRAKQLPAEALASAGWAREAFHQRLAGGAGFARWGWVVYALRLPVLERSRTRTPLGADGCAEAVAASTVAMKPRTRSAAAFVIVLDPTDGGAPDDERRAHTCDARDRACRRLRRRAPVRRRSGPAVRMERVVPATAVGGVPSMPLPDDVVARAGINNGA